MVDVFFTVLRMSGYGVVAALVVMVLQLLLGRARVSRTALLALWLIVAFRLVCPWSPPSPLSLFNWGVAEHYAIQVTRVESAYVGDVKAGVQFLDGFGSEEFDKAVAAGAKPVYVDDIHMNVAYYYENGAGNITPAQTFREVYGHTAAIVWLSGIGVCLAWGVLSYQLLRRKLRFAVKDEELPGVWYSDRIPSPCVAGLFRPQIYLTFGMSGEEKEYVLAHERQHIQNGDHLWKVPGWLILCVHWFNPLLWGVWAAFLSTLEEACDQRTLRELGEDKKSDYGQALLSLSSEKRFRSGFTPLAFGEGDTKGRIKTVLRYKKPLVWLTVVALVLGATAGLCVLTGKVQAEAEVPPVTPPAENVEDLFGTWSVSGVIYVTPLSSSSADYLLDRARGTPIELSADRFDLSGGPDGQYVLDHPVYEPIKVGDAIPVTDLDLEGASGVFGPLDVTGKTARGWRVLSSGGTDTGWHIYSVDDRLWLGRWVVHDNAATPHGEYWTIWEASRGGPPALDPGESFPVIANEPDSSPPVPPEPLAEWRADLTHNGADERIFVTGDPEYGGMFCLTVETRAGTILWQGEAATAHAGQNGYYLYHDETGYYLLNWTPYMSSGAGYYHYALFSLNDDGTEQVIQENQVQPDMNEVWGADPAALRAFETEINDLLSRSEVLLSTNYDTSGGQCLASNDRCWGDPEHPLCPDPWDSGADWFEELQSRARGTYAFHGEVVSVQEDRFMVQEDWLWKQGFLFSIPMDAFADGRDTPAGAVVTLQEGDIVSVDADGPLYRWRLPDEQTHVEAHLILSGGPSRRG